MVQGMLDIFLNLKLKMIVKKMRIELINAGIMDSWLAKRTHCVYMPSPVCYK